MLPKYLPCTVTASNLSHFYVLLPLDSPVGLEQRLDEVLKDLIQAEGPSPFPALTQIEAWGTEAALPEELTHETTL
ncbi:MAG: hypothetical protein LUG55_07485 [Clostridiales bacterium]|nr:hypothetical protein [Clostridiales bacterium]